MTVSRLTTEELLARLVGFDSTSRNSNLALADFICDYVGRSGVEIARNGSADGRKVNVVIGAGPADASRRGLTLSGHMDVVPAGDGWTSNPFELTRVGNRLVGRGACDMKGFLALALNRFAAVDPARLRHRLALLFTYDEELGTLGARRLVETWTAPEALPRATIIGEPTGLTVVHAHKGHLKLRLVLNGVAAHSAYPHLGRNAIEPAGAVIAALTRLRRELETERPPNAAHIAEAPSPTLNVATVAGGTAINVVPDRCVIELGVRLLPGMSSDAMIDRIRDGVARVLGDTSFVIEMIGDSPAMVLDEAAPIHRALRAATGQAESRGVAFTTDGGWLQRLDLDCVVFGPGSIEVAHRPDEFVPIGELVRADEILTGLVSEFTGAAA